MEHYYNIHKSGVCGRDWVVPAPSPAGLQGALKPLWGNLGLHRTWFRKQFSVGMGFSLYSYNAQCGWVVIPYCLRFINIRSCQTNLGSYFFFQVKCSRRRESVFQECLFTRSFVIALLEWWRNSCWILVKLGLLVSGWRTIANRCWKINRSVSSHGLPGCTGHKRFH